MSLQRVNNLALYFHLFREQFKPFTSTLYVYIPYSWLIKAHLTNPVAWLKDIIWKGSLARWQLSHTGIVSLLVHHHHHHQKNWNWRNWRARGGRERRMPDQLEPSNLTQWVVGDLSLIVFSCWLDGGRGPSICHLLVVVDAVLCWSQKCGSPFPLGLTYIVLCIIICTCNHNKVHGLSVFVW